MTNNKINYGEHILTQDKIWDFGSYTGIDNSVLITQKNKIDRNKYMYTNGPNRRAQNNMNDNVSQEMIYTIL